MTYLEAPSNNPFMAGELSSCTVPEGDGGHLRGLSGRLCLSDRR